MNTSRPAVIADLERNLFFFFVSTAGSVTFIDPGLKLTIGSEENNRDRGESQPVGHHFR